MEKKNLTQVVFKSEYTRRFPDPLNQLIAEEPHNIEHFILLGKAIDIPPGIPKKPNPRTQNIDQRIYREIRESLESGTEPSFHLKNKGITIIAHKVNISNDKETATLYFGEEDGIADGAHTYEIILAAQQAKTCPDTQYIKIEVLTGINKETGIDITEGLNTAMQVQEKSLANLRGDFDWIKKTLRNQLYSDNIAYIENEDKDCDIRDIIGYMSIFNKDLFPDGKEHPIMAYSQKARCLDEYIKKRASFEKLKPILPDILYLVDYVGIRGRERYNEEMQGRAGGMKGVYNSKKRGKYKFVFTTDESEYKIYDGALFPILSSLRFLVEQKKGDTTFSWRLDAFENVKRFYDEVAPQLITTTYKMSVTYNYKPNPIGKDETHWDNLYKTVALHFLETRQR